MTEVRRLLVISEPAPWVPSTGLRVGDWDIEVRRSDRMPAAGDGWDVVAFRTDLLPGGPSRVLETLRERAPDATLLPVAAPPDPREAISFLKQGAFEYLEEPLSPGEFLRALGEALENREAFREILALNRTLEAQKEQLLREKGELQRKNRELEAVSRLARSLAATLDLDEVLTQLAGCIGETFDFARVVLGVVDSEAACEVPRVVSPADAGASPEVGRWPLGDAERNPWIRVVLQEGRPLRVDDPATHPETRDTDVARLHRNPFVKIPMVARGRIVGTITAETRGPGSRVDAHDLELLGIFADTAALAMENARLYQTMKDLSVRDELTGLYNRRHLLHQLDAEWGHAVRHGMPLSLLMLDIDHFKALNDGNDHLTGDAALRKLAGLLLRNTRGIDTVARYGGEEFVVLLPRTSRENARVVAEKLRRAVETTSFRGEAVLPEGTLTVSLGAAGIPEDASSSQELLERADWALYRAKAGGRNRICLWEEGRAAAG